ncbi:MAG: acetyl-CoA acetyltransferase [Pseudomonadota bacterium]
MLVKPPDILAEKRDSDAAMVGWAHGPFGRHQNMELEHLIASVAGAAILDAGLDSSDIDSISLGCFGSGFQRQEFPSSLIFQALPELRFTPATRLENACATGSAALYHGLDRVRAGSARYGLVIGVEKMTAVAGHQVGDLLLRAAYLAEEEKIAGGFAGIFGVICNQYFQAYGDQSDALAQIAAKNHANGTANHLAHLQKDFGYEFCRLESDQNPVIAGPLKRTDCAPISDGAAAAVVCSLDRARHHPKAVRFRAAVQVNDFLPMSKRDIIAFEGCREAWGRAHQQAGTRISDLDCVETHDCFTIAELIQYEAMGLALPGQGASILAEGIPMPGGALPVNPSGGLKAKGHPIGATGVSQHVLCAMQLTNEANGFQVPDASLAGLFNMGGTAVANYVSILERVR